MNIACLQHSPTEGPGCLTEWARAHGHSFQVVPLYAGDRIPSPELYDWLMVLGGPMGVHDEREYPWLVSEKASIGRALMAGRTVVGICLGGQLIADVLGARVGPARQREVGWFPVTSTAEARGRFPLLPPSFQAVCWHSDTFDLPTGAVHLGSTQACQNQGFFLGDRVLAVQFHLEWPHQDLRKMVQDCPADFAPGRYVQKPQQLLEHVEWAQRANDLMYHLLDALPE